MDGSKETIIDIDCTGTVTCVECSPFEYCDSLVCYSSKVCSMSVQPTHFITIARLHPKREVCTTVCMSAIARSLSPFTLSC